MEIVQLNIQHNMQYMRFLHKVLTTLKSPNEDVVVKPITKEADATEPEPRDATYVHIPNTHVVV